MATCSKLPGHLVVIFIPPVRVFVLILLVITPIVLVVPVLIIQFVIFIQHYKINTGARLSVKPG